jgi:hypothetical protein
MEIFDATGTPIFDATGAPRASSHQSVLMSDVRFEVRLRPGFLQCLCCAALFMVKNDETLLVSWYY